jgi:hypothetical protein
MQFSLPFPVEYWKQTSTRAMNEVIIIAKASPASNVGAPH